MIQLNLPGIETVGEYRKRMLANHRAAIAQFVAEFRAMYPSRPFH